MHNVVQVGGALHNVIVIPDGDTQAVNLGGTHSVRGGTIAQKLYNPRLPTADRLQMPLLRVRGTLQPISWDAATDIVAELSKYCLEKFGELAWGMKRYSYQFYENTYAITKLAFGAIGSPNHAPHHAPAEGDDVPGLTDTGIDAFSAAAMAAVSLAVVGLVDTLHEQEVDLGRPSARVELDHARPSASCAV